MEEIKEGVQQDASKVDGDLQKELETLKAERDAAAADAAK